MIRLFALLLLLNLSSISSEKPNIILILADDMGWADMSHMGGKAPTPHLDKMAEGGMRFTDAHTSSSVCTPTRYGIMTGRYNWRSRLKKGVLGGFKEPLIQKSRVTIADHLKSEGYKTALIGKWHLGIGWTKLPKGQKITPEKNLVNHPKAKAGLGQGWNVDYSKKIDGPIEQGFDYFWGCGASLDMPPYVYLENDKILTIPTVVNSFNRRPGPAAADFDASQTLIHTVAKARQYIASQKADEPFFLYLPLTSPHTPVSPSEKWQGKSSFGAYGDFLMETDWVVGEVYAELAKQKLDQNTIVIFTADNGCSPDADISHMVAKGHLPNAHWRGAKSDIYEGGHRVPFLVTWPNKVKASSISHSTICTTDLFATFAKIANPAKKLPDNSAEDSYSFLTELIQTGKTKRSTTIHHSGSGFFAIRQGDWKLIMCSLSGGRGYDLKALTEKQKQALPPIQLYNLKNDPSEKENLWQEKPEIVSKLVSQLASEIKNGRSTPGLKQSNDGHPPFEQNILELFPALMD